MEASAVKPKARIWIAFTLFVILNLGVFAMYVQPEFLVTMVNQVWACF